LTRRLYWEQQYSKDFNAKLTGIKFIDDKIHVYLDQTLFHPEGGGQPSDRGFIILTNSRTKEKSRLKVLEVNEVDNGIVHVALTDKNLEPDFIDEEVWGEIDWEYRFDLMQQHTGQHILSRAFEVVLNARTIGFHLGDKYVSIDLDIRDLSETDRKKVELCANQVVFDDAPVYVKEYSPENLPPQIRRRIPVETDNIRVVFIGDFDACACGGTHLSSAASVGLVKINQIDKAHGGVRVIFRCGFRALKDYGEKEESVRRVASMLSQSPESVPEAVSILLERLKVAEKEKESLRRDLVAVTADGLISRASSEESIVFVAEVPNMSPGDLRVMAKRIVDEALKSAVLFCSEPQFSLVVASALKDGEPVLDARKVLSKLSVIYGLRGGGSPTLVQAGSKEKLAAPGDEILETLEEIVRR
jgi:alanyl-tRNA synthetase